MPLLQRETEYKIYDFIFYLFLLLLFLLYSGLNFKRIQNLEMF